jgi:outer membrane biosynthesis protein TonB
MRHGYRLMVLLAVGLAIIGCRKQSEPAPPEEQPTETNMVETAPPPSAPAPVLPPIVTPKANPKPKPKPAPEPTADQQILDDAAATGMTSRSSSDDSGAGNSQ